jgi:hypothetical protein
VTTALTRDAAIRRALTDLEPRALAAGHVTADELEARMAELGYPGEVAAWKTSKPTP